MRRYTHKRKHRTSERRRKADKRKGKMVSWPLNEREGEREKVRDREKEREMEMEGRA